MLAGAACMALYTVWSRPLIMRYHCCSAWNRLIDQPWTIMSIGLRDWADA